MKALTKALFFTSLLALTSTNLYATPAPYSSTLCKQKQFQCYTAKHNDSWDTLFKDPQTRELVMKLNRVNIKLHKGMKIAIPINSNLSLLDYSPLPRQISPPGNKTIMVFLKSLAWGAYDAQGQLVNWGPASGGKGYCSDIHSKCNTATGKFVIYRKEGQGCISKRFPVGRGGAPMPYCMFFHKGFALHGSYDVPGYNASHGCVRLFISDAKWINQEFLGDKKDLTVIVKGPYE